MKFPDPFFCPSPLCTFSIFFVGGGARGFLYRNWNLSRGAGFTYGHGVAGGGVKGGMMGERGSVFLLILKLRNSSSLSFDLKKLQPFAMGALRVLYHAFVFPFLWFYGTTWVDVLMDELMDDPGVVGREGGMNACMYSSQLVIKTAKSPHVFFVFDTRWASINSFCTKTLSLSHVYMYLCIHFAVYHVCFTKNFRGVILFLNHLLDGAGRRPSIYSKAQSSR